MTMEMGAIQRKFWVVLVVLATSVIVLTLLASSYRGNRTLGLFTRSPLTRESVPGQELTKEPTIQLLGEYHQGHDHEASKNNWVQLPHSSSNVASEDLPSKPVSLQSNIPVPVPDSQRLTTSPTHHDLTSTTRNADVGVSVSDEYEQVSRTYPSPSTTTPIPTLPSFLPSKDLFVRAIYFDDRPRVKGHHNASVFLVVARRNITANKLITGCQVGDHVAETFEARLIGETPLWRAFYDYIDHEEVMVDCYDLPVLNGSMGYIMYKKHRNSTVLIAASERPLMIPGPRLPPKSIEGKKYNMTIVACAKIFHKPPWMKEWLQYQKTIGVDHVHLDAEDSFQKYGGMDFPYMRIAMTQGFLSVDIWKKYLNPNELWYHNQGLIYEDCAYRFRGTYDYIVLVDTDDFFTPRVPGEKKLHYYIDRYCRISDIGSCKFKWVEYFPDHYHLTNASDADGNVTRRLSNYSHYIQGNPKSLHRTNVVVDAATHYAYKVIEGFKIEAVSMNTAYFAHLRHNKKPPKKGLKLGIPHSNACIEHVIDKILLFMLLILCMASSVT